MKCRFHWYLFFPVAVYACGCTRADQDYFPMGNSYRWEYVIEEQVNVQRQTAKAVVADLGTVIIEGTEYYLRRSAGGGTYYYKKSGAGISVSTDPAHPGKIILGFPLQTGTSWQAETRLDILHRRHESFSGGESFISLDEKIPLDFHIVSMNDTVEVPAGRFPDCMRIEGSGAAKVETRTRGIDHILVGQTEWYAKGTGLVKRKRTEASVPEKYRGELVQELVSVKR